MPASDLFEIAADEAQARGTGEGHSGWPEWRRVGRVRPFFAEIFFDLIQVRDEPDDAGGGALSGIKGFGEAASMEWNDMDRNVSDVLRRSATGGEHQLWAMQLPRSMSLQ